MKTFVHLWQYLAEFFLEWEVFQTNVVEKIKNTHHMFNTHYMFKKVSRKSCRLWDNVEKYGSARQAADNSIIGRMRFACWIIKTTDTHSEYVIPIAFPRQRWFRERALLFNLYVHYLSCKLTLLMLLRHSHSRKMSEVIIVNIHRVTVACPT
jgi:hypothetical protein